MREYSIILAADLPTPEGALSVIKRVADKVDGVKVGVPTLIAAGASILGKIRDLIGAKPLMVDLKVADIGFMDESGWKGTNSKIIKSIENSGATHVTVHGFPGPLSVAEAIAAARDAGMGALLLPLMSHAGARLCFSRPLSRDDVIYSAVKSGLVAEFPHSFQCNDVTEGILLLGEALDADGYIGPATRPQELQRYRAATVKPIWCPGFGRQDRLGRTLEEQFREWARIVGPESAAIVGSTIVNAADPATAAAEVAAMRDAAVG